MKDSLVGYDIEWTESGIVWREQYGEKMLVSEGRFSRATINLSTGEIALEVHPDWSPRDDHPLRWKPGV